MTLFRTEAKYHTLSSGTSPFRPHMGVPPGRLYLGVKTGETHKYLFKGKGWTITFLRGEGLGNFFLHEFFFVTS